mmetsp:Transcript_139813/g.247023  ORF Transcript_139813/g.247023 Transcript_139813/m.247023 type:complete len:320 (+) Transcript_139813:347-1306(+)
MTSLHECGFSQDALPSDCWHVFSEKISCGNFKLGVIADTFPGLLKICSYVFRQDLAELNSILIERIDAPYPALHCSAVLIQCQQLTQCPCIADGKKQRQGWSISRESFVGYQLLWNSFSLALIWSLAKSERIWLCEEIGHQLIVVGNWFACNSDWILGYFEAKELRRNGTTLVHQLVERVLAIRAGLTKIKRPCACRTFSPIHHHALAVALHIQLLDVRNEPNESLTVRQDCTTLVAHARGIPHSKQANDHWQILQRRCGSEVVIHHLATLQELFHDAEAILERKCQHTHSTPDREAATDPIPEAEYVGRVDAESLRLF